MFIYAGIIKNSTLINCFMIKHLVGIISQIHFQVDCKSWEHFCAYAWEAHSYNSNISNLNIYRVNSGLIPACQRNK